jgi:hypothetical protein
VVAVCQRKTGREHQSAENRAIVNIQNNIKLVMLTDFETFKIREITLSNTVVSSALNRRKVSARIVICNVGCP